MIRLTEPEFADIVEYFRLHYGINLDKKKVLIECRMSKELERYQVTSFAQYMRLLRSDRSGEIAGGMVNRLTTNYTYFMRESVHFSILTDKVFPELFGKKYGICQIWCAGCATGEECYTLAMCLDEYKEKNNRAVSTRILATDISEEVLSKAEKGIYPRREIENIPLAWQEKYCTDMSRDSFRVDENLKYNIRFRKHNLMEPLTETSRFDLIFCRNVMIYFDRVSRKQLVSRLEESLNPGANLFIDHAELLSRDETSLEQVLPSVYRKNGGVK